MPAIEIRFPDGESVPAAYLSEKAILFLREISNTGFACAIDEELIASANVVLYASVIGNHALKFELIPLIKGVVMTLGALDLYAEESLYGVGHMIWFHILIAGHPASGPVLIGHAGCGDEFENHLIIGHVAGKGFFDPVGIVDGSYLVDSR